MIKGIDVSENNGWIDWKAVKGNGIEFAIIRLGYGRGHMDSLFYKNVNEALEAGLKIGVYYYSYALTKLDARAEAEFMTRILEESGLTPAKLEMGVWFDMEDGDGYKERHGMPNDMVITGMCNEFIAECNRHGYNCGIYASLDWLENRIYMNVLPEYAPVYILILINPDIHRLLVRKCDEDEKNALRWCIPREDGRESRQIKSRDFSDQLFKLLDWDKRNRYKILGYRINFEGETMFIFDLMETDIHEDITRKDPKFEKELEELNKKSPVQGQKKAFAADKVTTTFGVPLEENQKALRLETMNEYVDSGSVMAKEHKNAGRKQ